MELTDVVTKLTFIIKDMDEQIQALRARVVELEEREKINEQLITIALEPASYEIEDAER